MFDYSWIIPRESSLRQNRGVEGEMDDESVNFLDARELRAAVGPHSEQLSRRGVRRVQQECNAFAAILTRRAHNRRALSAEARGPLSGSDIWQALLEDDRFAWVAGLVGYDSTETAPAEVPCLRAASAGDEQHQPGEQVASTPKVVLHRAFVRAPKASPIMRSQCRLHKSFLKRARACGP